VKRSSLLPAAVIAELALLVVVAVLLDRFGDAWWPATALMFGPRWIWGAPLLVLGPLSLRRSRRYLAPLLLAAFVLLGPILDLRLSPERLARRGEKRDLRVMTYNIGGGTMDLEGMVGRILTDDVDLVTFQERDAVFPKMARNVACRDSQCLASRFPIVRTDPRDRADFVAMQGSGGIIRWEVQAPFGTVSVTNVHLATVRRGLATLLHNRRAGPAALTEGSAERMLEAEAASAWAKRGTGPALVMGDFNTPVESAIYRRHWSSWENAFSTAGLGFGGSKFTRWHGIRIDHVLAGPGWRVLRAWVGPGFGGDHRPMLADLRWMGP
jgi:endonuclease/exonuclease/phosphatase (EEP) superfamily protein YafD